MEQVVDILNLLSNEKKGKDEKDESLTSIDKQEGDKIKRKYQEDKWKTENELLVEELAGTREKSLPIRYLTLCVGILLLSLQS